MMDIQRRTAEATQADKRVGEAQTVLARAMAAELEAVQQREAADAALQELRESVRKRPRTDGKQDATEQTATAEQEDEPMWNLWSLARWRKHESEVQSRRSVAIDISNDKALPPRGDEERGWRKHWRRGMIGSIQDWAVAHRRAWSSCLQRWLATLECKWR